MMKLGNTQLNIRNITLSFSASKHGWRLKLSSYLWSNHEQRKNRLAKHKGMPTNRKIYHQVQIDGRDSLLTFSSCGCLIFDKAGNCWPHGFLMGTASSTAVKLSIPNSVLHPEQINDSTPWMPWSDQAESCSAWLTTAPHHIPALHSFIPAPSALSVSSAPNCVI